MAPKNTSFKAIDDVSEKDLRLFNWPSKAGETWRHIHNYALRDEEGDMVDLFISGGEYVLTGILLPRPCFLNPPAKAFKIRVSIRLIKYEQRYKIILIHCLC